jgi:hypothetical protein
LSAVRFDKKAIMSIQGSIRFILRTLKFDMRAVWLRVDSTTGQDFHSRNWEEGRGLRSLSCCETGEKWKDFKQHIEKNNQHIMDNIHFFQYNSVMLIINVTGYYFKLDLH